MSSNSSAISTRRICSNHTRDELTVSSRAHAYRRGSSERKSLRRDRQSTKAASPLMNSTAVCASGTACASTERLTLFDIPRRPLSSSKEIAKELSG